MENFENSIVSPILSLDTEYATNPSKRDSVPLPVKSVPSSSPTSYETLDQYVQTMQHALLHETFHSIVSDYDERGNLGVIKLEVNGYQRPRSDDKRHVLDCEITVQALAAFKGQAPEGRNAEYLIQDNSVGILQAGKKPVLAFISDKTRKKHKTAPYYCLRVEFAEYDSSLANAFAVTFQSFSNLVPSRRQFEALAKIFDSPFRNCFVNPQPDMLQTDLLDDETASSILKSSFQMNSSQKKAISVAAKMVLNDSISAGAAHQMAMIQGPPGTGKTQTIAALIELLVLTEAVYRGPILVCAPSNAAVDQILLRLDRTPSLAPLMELTHRVGTRAGMSKSLKRYHVGDGDISDVQAKLKDALLVLTTLNSAGSNAIKQLSRPCCLIVDEAGQTTDLEFLIPIVKFKVLRVVVVGDPLQLPPTVLSCEAERHGFKRSFMERFYEELRRQNRQEKMLQLDVQFRMHPDICQFPCQHFYNGSFTTHPDILSRGSSSVESSSSVFSSPPKPYLVFDLQNTHESRAATGLSRRNIKEAEFVVDLVKSIVSRSTRQTTSKDVSVGVITPYLSQMHSLNRLFANLRIDVDENNNDLGDVVDGELNMKLNEISISSEAPNSEASGVTSTLEADSPELYLEKTTTKSTTTKESKTTKSRLLSDFVDVRTIDSFQGDERDVIVFSCVRAADAESASGRTRGGVGFVGDRHRMNVALTRAREALYIVGDMGTLAENSDWKALRQDAIGRGVHVKLTGKKDVKEMLESVMWTA